MDESAGDPLGDVLQPEQHWVKEEVDLDEIEDNDDSSFTNTKPVSILKTYSNSILNKSTDFTSAALNEGTCSFLTLKENSNIHIVDLGSLQQPNINAEANTLNIDIDPLSVSSQFETSYVKDNVDILDDGDSSLEQSSINISVPNLGNNSKTPKSILNSVTPPSYSTKRKNPGQQQNPTIPKSNCKKPKARYYCEKCDETLPPNYNDATCVKCNSLLYRQCQKCDEKFLSPSSLFYHLKYVCFPAEITEKCDKCGRIIQKFSTQRFLSGSNDEFYNEFSGKTIKEAIKIIHTPVQRNARYRVLKFTNVIPELGQYTSSKVETRITQLSKVLNFEKLQLREAQNLPGLYINFDKNHAVLGDVSLLKIILRGTNFESQLPSGNLEVYVTKAIQQISDPTTLPPVQSKSFLEISKGFGKKLMNVPDLISHTKYPDNLPKIPGKNVPVFNLAGKLSFTEVKLVDRNFDFCSLMRFGMENARKLWMVILPESSDLLRRLLRDAMNDDSSKESSKIKKESEGDEPAEPQYLFNLDDHKDIIITPKFCTSHGIKFQIIEQYPGDLIYIGPFIYYQVFNTGINLTEYVDVGSINCISPGDGSIFCVCAYSPKEDSETPSTGDVSEKKFLQFRCDHCHIWPSTKDELIRHLIRHLPKNINSKIMFPCELCEDELGSKDDLIRHLYCHIRSGNGVFGSGVCIHCEGKFPTVSNSKKLRASQRRF